MTETIEELKIKIQNTLDYVNKEKSKSRSIKEIEDDAEIAKKL